MEYKRFQPLRSDQITRDQYAETFLSVSDFIYPLFVVEGKQQKSEILNLWDVYHMSVDVILEEIEHIKKLGINKILLFGVIDSEHKTPDGKQAWAEDSLLTRTLRRIRNVYPDLFIITDICLCGYTSHGHCGIIKNEKIDNDATLPFLAEMAKQHALAGASMVAPSAMMDGQVLAIAEALKTIPDNKTGILGYSAKFASSFYGPFRNAAGSAPAFGDRKSYQMDYRVKHQAVMEIEADIKEGADWVMVKPAISYLDIIQLTKTRFPAQTLVAYHVSGEYMMIKSAAKLGIVDETNAMLESAYSMKRAGADFIISYYSKRLAELVKK
jgi:porphobilinogen synthase